VLADVRTNRVDFGRWRSRPSQPRDACSGAHHFLMAQRDTRRWHRVSDWLAKHRVSVVIVVLCFAAASYLILETWRPWSVTCNQAFRDFSATEQQYRSCNEPFAASGQITLLTPAQTAGCAYQFEGALQVITWPASAADLANSAELWARNVGRDVGDNLAEATDSGGLGQARLDLQDALNTCVNS
jgi:hypothetical protein